MDTTMIVMLVAHVIYACISHYQIFYDCIQMHTEVHTCNIEVLMNDVRWLTVVQFAVEV